MKILIAEDDENIRNGLVEVLRKEGYEALAAADGNAALDLYKRESPDFVCLDIMMPGINGYDLCKAIRKTNARIPVIFISAKSEEVDRVVGLELGADDFIVKPFGVREVLARIRAVTRRLLADAPEADQNRPFEMGEWTVFAAELRAKRGGDVVDLSLREARILRLLHDNAGSVVTRDQFFNACWGLDYMPNSRTLDQHISQLRKRLEDNPKNPAIIRTVQGAGYRYEADGAREN